MNPLWGCVIRLSLKASAPGLFLGLTAAVTPAANAGGDSAGEVGAAGAAPGGSRRPRHSTGLPRSPRGADHADNEGTRSPSFSSYSNSHQVGPVKPKPPPLGENTVPERQLLSCG